jgi:hypothetical protein
MWNTGLNKLFNNTSGSIFFIDQEDRSVSFTLPSAGVLSYGPVFPWCDNSLEVTNKAFRVHRGTDETGPLLFFMFQYYRDDICYFIPGPLSVWASRVTLGEGPSSYLNVSIGFNDVPTAQASTPDTVIGSTFLRFGDSSEDSQSAAPSN